MAKAEFKAEGVGYVARGGFHHKTPYGHGEAAAVFDEYGRGVDGIVLEVRGSESLKVGGDLKISLEGVVDKKLCKENSKLVDYAFDREISLYVVEPVISSRVGYALSFGGIISGVVGGLLREPAHYRELNKNAVSDVEVSDEFVQKMYNEFMRSGNKGVLGSCRNAIWTKKISEFIVPALEKSLGRLPRLGLDIGAAHMGIKYDFVNASRRDELLESMRTGRIKGFDDVFSYKGYDVGKVGGVYIAERKNGNWKVSEKNSKLF